MDVTRSLDFSFLGVEGSWVGTKYESGMVVALGDVYMIDNNNFIL